MIDTVAEITLLLLAIAMLLCFVRLVRGPGLPDRIVALDTMYINSLALLVVLGIRLHDSVYFEAALLIAMLGFVGTVSLSRYVLRGDLID
jgi:multicomponent K+:H+ antiporter subunit F